MPQMNYYGHGKILLTGEYVVLDGAMSLAFPSKLGQRLSVTTRNSYEPGLTWKSYDLFGNCWAEAKFELWRFNLVENNDHSDVYLLQNVLRQIRKQNPHFLREDQDVLVETYLEFPRSWGLGSSSSLLSLMAQWAFVSPFELAFACLGGSGYDIACAQSSGPILYQLENNRPTWSIVDFKPDFIDNLYLLYQGKKQNSRHAIDHYRRLNSGLKEHIVKRISDLTMRMHKSTSLIDFEAAMAEHEIVLSELLSMKTIKDEYFSDYWGQVKSLGAWGGDMALVSSHRDIDETRQYFADKGYWVLVPFKSLLINSTSSDQGEIDSKMSEFFSL